MKRPDSEKHRLPPLLHEGHKRPVSRRDFLAAGALSGAAMVMSPSLFGLLGKSGAAHAQALQCGGVSQGAGRIPFVCFDLAGGASVAGSNVITGGPGGPMDLLSDAGYTKLGLPMDMRPQLAGQTNSELGLTFHSDSGFLRGILDRTSAATRANVNGFVVCARSSNDTENNPHNPMYGINKAGADGSLVTLIGTENSESGGKSVAPMAMIDPTVRPVKVARPSEASGLIDTGKLIDLLDQNDAAEVMLAAERITELKLARMNEQQIVEDLIRCGFVESTNLVRNFGNPALIDPLLDTNIVGAPGSIFSQGELGDSIYRKTASVMKLVVNGFAGAGTIELGGFDYHNGTRSRGEIADFEAGQCMGAVLEYAARQNQQLMLYVFSDGSVDSDGEPDNSQDGRGKGTWESDSSSTASVFALVYDPAGRPQLTSPAQQQIGHFRQSGDIETAATPISNNVEQLAQAIVLNYLALHDEVGRLDAVLPNHGLGTGPTRDALVAFQPIRTG